MADDNPSPAPGTDPPSPLPEATTIPIQLVESWLAIPALEYVAVELTRGDFDKLYGFVNRGYLSQSAFQQAMIDYSNGRVADANRGMHEAQRLLIEGQNELRQFMAAVMASATLKRGRHGG